MFQDFLKNGGFAYGLSDRIPKTQAKMVEYGYGQVEPNHLSAQRTAQIYAQLPANPDIQILEQGQFVKYDYAANDNGIGEVNFEGAGEWMMVYNEIKLYKNHLDGSKQWDCEFAMLKDDYQARVYTPYDWEAPELEYHDWHKLNGMDHKGNTSMKFQRFFSIDPEGQSVTVNGVRCILEDGDDTYEKDGLLFNEGDKVKTFKYEDATYQLDANGTTTEKVEFEIVYDDVTTDVPDIYELNWTNDPWRKLGLSQHKKMRKGTAMVPRVFKTNVGDIMTTNTVDEDFEEIQIGDIVAPRTTDGILCKDGDTESMQWQVVKKYDMPDHQNAVKLMRIK